MSDLARLVEALFALRGFESETSTDSHALLFRRKGERVAVRVRDSRDPVPAFAAREAADALPSLGHAVFACLGDLSHEARSILEAGGVEVWTREKLTHEVGKAYLEAAERGALPRAFSPPVHDLERAEETAPTPPPSIPVALPDPAPEVPPPPAPVASPPPPAAASLWNRPATPPVVPPASPAAAPPPPPEPLVVAPPAQALAPDTVVLQPLFPPAPPAVAPRLAAPDGEKVVAAIIDREHAQKLGVGRLLRVDAASLELVPFHAYRYACRLEARGAPSSERKGLIAVDAVAGNAREMPEPAFGATPELGERLAALLPDLDAKNLAKRKIVELHTQKLRIQASLGRSAAIVEDRWVRPDPKSIQLESQGVWWLPVWRLQGQNGTMRINAATGAVEEEKLKRAFAQDAEFV